MISRRATALDQYLAQNARQTPQRQRREKHSPSTDDSGSWQTNFFSSQRQCLEELHRLMRKVNSEEGRVRQHMKEYQFGVLERLGLEYAALKTELNRILDGAYGECLIKVKEGFLGDQMMELERAIKMLENIRQKIRSFEFELETNYTYKKGVAHVVMENFEAQRAEIIGNLNSALKNYEGKVFLKVEPHEFGKMKQALANLFSYTGHRNGGSNNSAPFAQPRMFSVPPSSTLVQPSVPYIPNIPLQTNSINQNEIPPPLMNPPFKPFPSKHSESPRQSNNPSINRHNSPSPSGIRYTAPNPDFDRIFNEEGQQKVQSFQQPITYQPNPIIHRDSRDRSNSPQPNSHRNRDLIRQSNRSGG